jgi:chemotaxis protein CheD
VTYQKEITLHVGGVHASAEPAIMKTLLGSCVAVVLWDPHVRVAGMNHFLLPEGGSGDNDLPTRFGVHAMDRLVGEMLKLGGDPRRFVVKVFGGASVLALGGRVATVAKANVDFARTFLAREGYQIAAKSVGGTQARMLQLFTDTGRVVVRRVTGPKVEARVVAAEQKGIAQPPRFGNVTLF